jgi:ComF family protein
MPLTNFARHKENPVKLLFENVFPVEAASAMFWFVGGTEWQRIVHNFKYYGRWLFAQKMGEWLGEELQESGNFDGIDLIVPVPLHISRQQHRGYNQAACIAKGISQVIGVEVCTHVLVRTVATSTQTRMRVFERHQNTQGIFAVQQPEVLAHKHVLLVDDVITTGATLLAAAQALKEKIPTCKISIATLAVASA